MNLIYNTIFGIIFLISSIVLVFTVVLNFEDRDVQKAFSNLGNIILEINEFEIKEINEKLLSNYYLVYNPVYKNYNNLPYFFSKDPFSYSCSYENEILKDCRDFSYFYSSDFPKELSKIDLLRNEINEKILFLENYCLPRLDSEISFENFYLSIFCYSLARKISNFVLQKTYSDLLTKSVTLSFIKKIQEKIKEKIYVTVVEFIVKKLLKKSVTSLSSSFLGPISFVVATASWLSLSYDIYYLKQEIELLKKKIDEIEKLSFGVPYYEIRDSLFFIKLSEEEKKLISNFQNYLFLCEINKRKTNCELKTDLRFKLNDNIRYVTGKLIFYFPFYENAIKLENKFITKIPVGENEYLVLILDKQFKDKFEYLFNLIKSNNFEDFLRLTEKNKILMIKKDNEISYYILFKIFDGPLSSFVEIYYENKIKELKELEEEIRDLNFGVAYLYKEKFFYFNENKIEKLFNESLTCFYENKKSLKPLFENYLKIKNKLIKEKIENLEKLLFLQFTTDFFTFYFLERDCKESIKNMKDFIKLQNDLYYFIDYLSSLERSKSNQEEFSKFSIYFSNYFSYSVFSCNLDYLDFDFLESVYFNYLEDRDEESLKYTLQDTFVCEPKKIRDIALILDLKNYYSKESYLNSFLNLRNLINQKLLVKKEDNSIKNIIEKLIENLENNNDKLILTEIENSLIESLYEELEN